MVGAAYETSALYGAALTLPEIQPDTTETSAAQEISVSVEIQIKHHITVRVLLKM